MTVRRRRAWMMARAENLSPSSKTDTHPLINEVRKKGSFWKSLHDLFGGEVHWRSKSRPSSKITRKRNKRGGITPVVAHRWQRHEIRRSKFSGNKRAEKTQDPTRTSTPPFTIFTRAWTCKYHGEGVDIKINAGLYTSEYNIYIVRSRRMNISSRWFCRKLYISR